MPLIWGRHPVLEALRAGRPIDRLYLAEGAKAVGVLGELIALARNLAVPTQSLDRRALDRLSDGANHQGVIAEVATYRYRSLDDLIAAGADGADLPLVVALDSLEDPQNFGTLMRTADAVAVTGVLIPEHRSVGVTPAVEKASAGAVEHVSIARATNVAKALILLKNQGYWVVGLDAEASESYNRFRVDVPLVLVIGAEGRGLGRLVRETCDFTVKIPQRGHVASLNAAVAASIVLYEIWRRRGNT